VDVELVELGTTLVHPTIDYDLATQFTAEEIKLCSSLTTAIQSGQLIWRKTAGGTNEIATDYDPDFLEVEELAEGQNDEATQMVRRRGYRTSLDNLVIPTTEPYVYILTEFEHHIHRFTGGKQSYTTKPQVRMPDATKLDVGHQYMVFNDSLGAIEVADFDGNILIEITITKRALLFLADNSTSAGVWNVIAVGKSSLQGTAPVLAYYGGNAGNGRYLEVFPGEGTDSAPFLVPTNSIIVAVVAAASATTSGILEIRENGVAIYSIPYGGLAEVINLGLAVPVSAGAELSFVKNGGGNIQKPRLAVYLSGA
jgi:hypothetical protein